MLALKPSLFPLPLLCCLLFLQSAFHSGFNSLQTLPNGFLTWGPSTLRHHTAIQKFHAPLGHKKGDPFPTLCPLPLGCSPALLCTPDTKFGGQGGKSAFVELTAVALCEAAPAEDRTCPKSFISSYLGVEPWHYGRRMQACRAVPCYKAETLPGTPSLTGSARCSPAATAMGCGGSAVCTAIQRRCRACALPRSRAAGPPPLWVPCTFLLRSPPHPHPHSLFQAPGECGGWTSREETVWVGRG